MAKDSIRDFSATAGSNTDIQSVNIDENCPASGINNAIRELMVDLKNVSTGAVNLETPGADQLNVDNLRLDGNTISSIDTNGNIIIDPDGTGNVGINVASPTSQLTIGGNTNTTAKPTVQITDTTAGASLTMRGQSPKLYFDITSGGVPKVLLDGAGIEFKDGTLDAEGNVDVKIDGSGNLLVGKTSSAFGTTGVELQSNGLVVTNSGTTAYFNRTSSDGNIAEFYKDGGTVGNIGTSSSALRMFSTATNYKGLAFQFKAITPTSNAGVDEDNSTDLGSATIRFDDVRATNGTIQTSDENEKQNIASLTTAEMTAAKAISKLFKTFKWQDKVAAKGDAARTHTGVIAQEVQTAMSDAGLDASKYAFWCSDTWWETSTDVAAVEADEEAGVEARDAYTRVDTYDTAEEAPEGATQRTRLGVRYPELLAFIGAATEQRLADIETRLTALEA